MAQIVNEIRHILHEIRLATSLTFAGGPTSAVLAKLGGNLWNLRSYLARVPRKPFSEDDVLPSPNFSNLESWIAHPGNARGSQTIEDANHLAELGQHTSLLENRHCDCFFVVDSCFTPELSLPFPKDQITFWNAPLQGDAGSAKQQLAAKIVEQMRMRTAAGASCFNQTCRIYAPKYRQVSILALVGYSAFLAPESSDPRQEYVRCAIDLAYEDVRRAFLHFVDDPSNSGRPFILAGHSQGSMHLIRLLQDEVDKHPLRLKRFVHAYLTGYCVPMQLFSRTLNNVRPSSCASDTSSVSSWRTGAEDHVDILPKLVVSCFFCDTGWQRTSYPFLATNPVTWSAHSDLVPSDPVEHRGALWPLPSGVDPRDHAGTLSSGVTLRLGHLSAASQDPIQVSVRDLARIPCGQIRVWLDELGMLRMPRLQDSMFSLAERDWLLYHDLDFALFHINVRDNVALRLDSWRPRSKL